MRRRWLLLGCAGAVWLGACGAADAATLLRGVRAGEAAG